MGIGGMILVLVLVAGAYFLGFAVGQGYLLNKIKEVCGYETYRNVLNELHTDANKEE